MSSVTAVSVVPGSDVHAGVGTDPGTVTTSPVWIDRDLSWLAFNRRVLAQALDDRVPVLERVKFLAIATTNLDEFFMKRIAVLREAPPETWLALSRRLREALEPCLAAQAACFLERLVPELARQGVHLRRWDELSATQRQELDAHFDSQISPALTPLVIHQGQPFPFFSNLSLSLAFLLHDPRTGESVDARVKVPADLAQWVRVHAEVAPEERVFVRLHEIIRENVAKLYPGVCLSAPTLFRLTRDAEVDVDDELGQNVREAVRQQVRQRRFEPAVRLEFAPGADARLREMLRDRFELSDEDVYEVAGELDGTSLFQIASLDLPHLRDTPWIPVVPSRLAGGPSIFEVLQAGDLLVHHPYESFDDSVEHFIATAADDPQTVSIKMTVYRVGDDTPFVRSLICAAESGKQVACVIELKARFDEARNLHWAAELERAGAHVTVGNLTLKTHAKVALVVRRERDGLRSYAHIGTGNYHVRTARLYTDVGLLTCDPALTADVVRLFHHLTGRSTPPVFEKLLVAPGSMRSRFLDLIAAEVTHRRAGRSARIVAKMNQLEDPAIIAALCGASQAGVPVDLIVRGFCCLQPGLAGVTENIRVRSIIGRFLEHSRIFHFAAGQADPLSGEFFIGSADWMSRNLSRRVEVVAPVADREARVRLWQILTVALNDRDQAWGLDADGTYGRMRTEGGPEAGEATGTHDTLMRLIRQPISG